MQPELNRFPSCLSVVFTISSATSKPRTTAFWALRLTTMMVNYNVPRYSDLTSEQHRNHLFKFKLVLSSISLIKHGHDGSFVQTDYKLVPFQLQLSSN